MGESVFARTWRDIVARRSEQDKAEFLDVAGLQGADTSSWQSKAGAVQWTQVAASGCSFALIKASEANSKSYPTLDAQFHGALNAGILPGLYCYAVPGEAGPVETADAFAAQVNRLGATPANGFLPPALDLEEGGGDLAAWAQSFIARFRQQTGCRRVMVYSDASFFKDRIGESWMDEDIVLWIAHFGAAQGKPAYLTPRVAIHQYSQTGRVPGINGDVDLDYAIWPLSQIIGSEDTELTPDEHQMLIDLQNKVDWMYGQFAGLGPDGSPASFPQVPGWPTLPNGTKLADGTNERLSLLDFGRRGNEQLTQLTSAVEAALAKTPTAAAPLDVKSLADELVAEFLGRLGTLPPVAAPITSIEDTQPAPAPSDEA